MPLRIVTVANVEGQPMRLLYWLLITTLIMLFALIVLFDFAHVVDIDCAARIVCTAPDKSNKSTAAEICGYLGPRPRRVR